MNLERRYIQGEIICRESADTQNRFGGLALRFGVIYDMGWFSEEVSREAFAKTDMIDVLALFNHDSNIVLGRTSAGTLTLNVTDEGLQYEFVAPNSPNGHNVAEAIRRGDIKQSSWGFTINDDRWETRNGKDHRIITGVKRVYDVSPVTFPANPDTTVAKRSKEKEAMKQENYQVRTKYATNMALYRKKMQL